MLRLPEAPPPSRSPVIRRPNSAISSRSLASSMQYPPCSDGFTSIQAIRPAELGAQVYASAHPGRRSAMSRRRCFLLRVHPARLDASRRRHEGVWPEMLRALADTGWRNYSLFLHDDGLLVGYVEADDLQASLAAMARPDVNRRGRGDRKGTLPNCS